MAENQYILRLRGLLDDAAADRLLGKLEECRAGGARRLELDCREMEGSLFDALSRFLDEARRRGLPLTFLHLPPGVALQCQLLGLRVAEHGMSLPPEESESRPPAGAMVCRNCENHINVGAPGHYACPYCDAHFRVDQSGRMRFYESLT